MNSNEYLTSKPRAKNDATMTLHLVKIVGATLYSVLLLTCACSAAPAEQAATQLPGYEAAKSIDVKVGRTTGVTLVGLGVELDPHFFSQNVTRAYDGPRAQDWAHTIAPRIRKMQIERFRVMLLPHWWEPYNDNDNPAVTDPSKLTFESAEMQSLCKVLDLAQEIGAEVTLVLWGCPIWCDQVDLGTIGRHFLCPPDGKNWVTAPESNEEFAENFSVVAKHLIETKGYSCVKELTPFNEPDGNVCELAQYIPLVKALDQRLRADGIRDKVRLNLSDNTDTRRFFLDGCADQLKNEADLFNSHTYIFGYETPNSAVINWERENVASAKQANKNHFVGEFGSNQCVGASRQKDINGYERGVLMTRHVINFLNAGAVGVSYWSLLDQYYNRNASYTEMQQLGLWYSVRSAYAVDPDQEMYRAIRNDFQVRPQYYSFSLLTRFIRKGSEVFPLNLDNEFAAGGAYRNQEGKWSYVFANNSDRAVSLNLDNQFKGGQNKCNVYRYEQKLLPDDDSLLAPSMVLQSTKQGFFEVCVPAHSVVVLTQM